MVPILDSSSLSVSTPVVPILSFESSKSESESVGVSITPAVAIDITSTPTGFGIDGSVVSVVLVVPATVLS